MPPRRRSEAESQTSRRRPATTPIGRENQLISLAADLAEKRLREGTASAQEICQLLKLGSSREKLEQQRLAHENELTQAKLEAMEAAKRVEAMYSEAMDAFRSYSGHQPVEDEDVL